MYKETFRRGLKLLRMRLLLAFSTLNLEHVRKVDHGEAIYFSG